MVAIAVVHAPPVAAPAAAPAVAAAPAAAPVGVPVANVLVACPAGSGDVPAQVPVSAGVAVQMGYSTAVTATTALLAEDVKKEIGLAASAARLAQARLTRRSSQSKIYFSKSV